MAYRDQHDHDLQVDGDGVSAPIAPQRLKMFEKMAPGGERNDSGMFSMDSLRCNSGQTDDIVADSLCDSDKVQPMDSVDTEEINARLDRLQVSEPETVSEKVSETFASMDEGYSSKSMPEDASQWKIGTGQETGGQTVYYCESGGVSQDAIEAYAQDEDGDTQLHMAIIQLAEAIALQLISFAPNHDWLNLVNTLLQTPLHLAVITRQGKIVRRLMAAGASIDVRDLHGNTPLHIACREGYEDILQHLLMPVYYEETLENKYEIPYQRVPQDLEAKNYEGHTCLHLAAQGTHLKVMEMLIKKGAKINAQDGKSGRTVLHYASETGNRILLEFLLGHRELNLDSCTYGGLTPVVLAAGRKFGDVVGILQAHGADCSSLQEDSEDSDDDMYDDFLIGGEPLSVR